jgi:hypothetical protein
MKDHLSLKGCPEMPFRRLDGIDDQQHEILKRRKQQGKVMTEEERWYEVFWILFPDHDPKAVPSPCALYNFFC